MNPTQVANVGVAPPAFDKDQYRGEVLGLSGEAEEARAQQLLDDARALGLKVPEIEVSAPLAASMASGLVDLSSPVLSSGSSATDQNSIGDGSITPSLDPLSSARLNEVVSSLSDVTIASEQVKAGSTRSLASLSTRPTSYCSSESRAVLENAGSSSGTFSPSHRHSILSFASVDKKEKRRHSLKNAIGRIYFRKKRTPSSVILPPDAHIVVSKGEGGVVDHVFIETRPGRSSTSPDGDSGSSSTVDSLPRLEIPIYDRESVQRSAEEPRLAEMLERHQLERDRHVAFQETALRILRQRHQAAISTRQSENERLEEEMREKNLEHAARMEERQLVVEMEQQRDFHRAKQNSRTRIKHMEGYFRNASPPPSSSPATQHSSESFSGSESTTPPTRRFTRQQKEQLERQYRDHEMMDALHEARIKVLRERQELRLQEAMARMERELHQMCAENSKSITAMQADHRCEESSLIQALDSQKIALRHRWNLEEAILRKQLEIENGHIYGPLPPISFSRTNTNAIDPASNSKGTPAPATHHDSQPTQEDAT
ncbi:hypothetical protein N7539_009318 [Penicillium diatomitis]|uniref:Uncharacterized protein n=1 Tax=Penicillium diatomitis TaxID=2819901 RepID=A0A9X0BJK6_9EURO|nr:uncharacterized protein N7539_009318 [Penicillium diatomitis]KAJ5469700.1 hypothetical protein N7539_009318 [Penicillium diatomitis]